MSLVTTPETINGYRVLKHVGSGAASEIYCVFDPKSSRVFALKQVILDSKRDKDDRFLVQAENEVRISKKLSHDVIRKIHSIEKIRPKGFTRTEVTVLMEFVDGRPLDELFDLSVEEKLSILCEVSDGLAHMNDKGYVHADMKPTNVMVNEERVVKIIDLGQAHPIGKAKERIQGTPGFMAPEQTNVEALTERTDVFNFGATMYWVLTGQEMPTSGSGSVRQAATLPPLVNTINPRVSTDFAEIVNVCLNPNPHARWRDMHQLTRQLEKLKN